MAKQRWQESAVGFDSIDEDAGVIRGVKILGHESKNGRSYLPEAVEKAAPLYEGAKVNIDHVEKNGSKTRKTRERWGKLQEVKVRPEGLFGDLHYLKSHEMTPAILEAVRRFGDSGLSHDAGGELMTKDGKRVVHKIHEVYSVDFVSDPATNKNLFEGVEPMKRKVLDALRENVKNPVAAGMLARITEMATFDKDLEIEATEGSEALVEAIGASVRHVLESNGKLEDRLTACRKMLGEKEPEIKVIKETVTDDTKLTEAVGRVAALETELKTLREEKDRVEQSAACKKLLEAAKRDVSDVRVQALMALPAENRQSLVESWPVAGRPEKSPGRIQEAQQNQKELPKTLEEFKARIA